MDAMETLLTLAARAFPLLCPPKEFAVLVLFAVSSRSVVFGAGMDSVVVWVRDPPPHATPNETPKNRHNLKVVFTEGAPGARAQARTTDLLHGTRMLMADNCRSLTYA